MPHGQEPINESHSLLVSSLFSFSAPGSFLPSDLCSIKKWFIMGGCVKRWTFFWNKISLTSLKGSKLNAPRPKTPVSYSLLESSVFLFNFHATFDISEAGRVNDCFQRDFVGCLNERFCEISTNFAYAKGYILTKIFP